MAEPPSTSDLLLLIPGFKVVKNPDLTADFGEDYYLNPAERSNERTLRETAGNILYLNSPNAAWQNVRFRDWLIATLFGNIADNKHDFTAISEDVRYSIDLLAKKFTRDSDGVSDDIKQILTCDSGERTYFSTLTLGISQQKVGSKQVLLFGAGMRRRAELWLRGDEALQVDAEFFVPFVILPNHNHGPEVLSSSVRSINAGIMLRNTKEQALFGDKDKELTAMRFNLRIPFKVHTPEGQDLQTEFGKPEVNIQKKVKNALDWEPFKDWKDFLKEYCDRDEVGDLLNSPFGPILGEKISDGSGVTDLIFDQEKRDEIKANFPRFVEDVKDTNYLLRHVTEWQPPDKDDPEPHSGSRKLGSVLQGLGIMKGKPPVEGEIEYEFKPDKEVTVWSVLNRIIAELDGFPLYVSGLKSKKDKYNRIAVSLASQESTDTPVKHYFGVAALAYNILLNPVSKKDDADKKGKSETPSIVLSKDNFTTDDSILLDTDEDEQKERETGGGAKEEKSKVDVLLHFGKWFSGETLDDNWMLRLLPKTHQPGKQRIPIPGVRVLPFKRVPEATDPNKANFSWTFLFELMSLGIDFQGMTKEGLKFLEGLAGYFGLGAVEVRVTFNLSLEDINNPKKTFFDRFAFGIGVKLKDLRLSLGPKTEDEKKKKKKGGDEIIEGLQELLADDWAVIPATEPKKRTVKTRLSAKKKDKFSISIGYLSPLKDGGNSTLDVQLYDEKGSRGKMVLIPIDRLAEPLYLKQIGIALKGMENVEIRKGLPDSAQLTVMLTGGIRLPVFELGFIGAKLTFQLNNPGTFKFTLDGLDVSVKFGDVIISGSFMKIGIEYAGSLTVSIPKGSFSAMGFFGSLRFLDFASETDTYMKLNTGIVPPKLAAKLKEKNITPAAQPVRRATGGDWELHTSDNKQYTITEHEGEFVVLRPQKTFFIYVTLSAASGTGIQLGPIQITGLVFGYGYNRRVKVPTIDKAAGFPLVKIVMGQGGYQEEDKTFELHNQLAKPVEDPIAILEKMKDVVVPELGSQFACGGVRFTISGTIDCFALIIVQWGGDEGFELSLLGLARFRLPRDTTARALCYVELQVLMTIKPKEGTFKLQALLTGNSWIINKDCKLTGGFAVFAWFDGEHKGDVVVTLGGYHPRFRRPEHYPVVPRLGLNWPVNDNLTIKGGCYWAFTPSCAMFGAKMEAVFHSGRISAWFTAYLDVVINRAPIFFEAELGISLRVEARFFLKTFSLTIAATIEMWGPPVGGIAHIDLTFVKFDIKFNDVPRPARPELIKTWQEFCHNFLNLSGGDRRAVKDPVPAFPVVQPNLVAGRNNLNNLPNALRKDSKPTPDDEVWKVRPDELELAATAAVPATTINIGKAKVSSDGVQNRSTSGRSMMVTKALTLESQGLWTKNSTNKIGVHPMGRDIQSVLNVTIVRDDASGIEPVDVPDWTKEEEVSSLPAGLWEPGQPNMRPSEPSAKLISGCITGIKRLKPKRGALGNPATPPLIQWNPLTVVNVPRPATTQEKPATGGVRNVEQLAAKKQTDQKDIVAALASVGFSLTWQQLPQAEVRFRELQADPLAGAVAA